MYLNLLKKEIKDYKEWLNDTNNLLLKLIHAIYQNDDRNILIEKISSYGIASITGGILWNILGAFTGVGILFTIVTTIGSLIFSKVTFNKLYGKVRNNDDLSNDEKLLVSDLKKYIEFIKQEKIKLLKKGSLTFELYPLKRQKLNNLINLLESTNLNLSFMYKKQYKNYLVRLRYKQKKFKEVYAKVKK